MKVNVDAVKCNGHARCFAVSEELFPLDEDGFTVLRGQGEVEIPAGLEEKAIEAADLCPEAAITTIA